MPAWAKKDWYKSKNLSDSYINVYKRRSFLAGSKNIVAEMAKNGKDPVEIAEEEGLFQKSDEEELIKVAEKIISENATGGFGI